MYVCHNVMMHYNKDMHEMTSMTVLLEMDQYHDVLIYGPGIQIGISTQIVRVAPQCCKSLKLLYCH